MTWFPMLIYTYIWDQNKNFTILLCTFKSLSSKSSQLHSIKTMTSAAIDVVCSSFSRYLCPNAIHMTLLPWYWGTFMSNNFGMCIINIWNAWGIVRYVIKRSFSNSMKFLWFYHVRKDCALVSLSSLNDLSVCFL